MRTLIINMYKNISNKKAAMKQDMTLLWQVALSSRCSTISTIIKKLPSSLAKQWIKTTYFTQSSQVKYHYLAHSLLLKRKSTPIELWFTLDRKKNIIGSNLESSWANTVHWVFLKTMVKLTTCLTSSKTSRVF